jgi:hypothetical protein
MLRSKRRPEACESTWNAEFIAPASLPTMKEACIIAFALAWGPMNHQRKILPVIMTLLLMVRSIGSQTTPGPKNFIFFGGERARIAETTFLKNEQIVGAQLKYTWRELEPKRDQYALGVVLKDLAFLESHGKRLFVQIQDVSFTEDIPLPAYLLSDPGFSGGAARKYEYEGDDETKEKFDGWVARRWDPAVRARFIRLLEALGKELDGRIEGLNLPETSIEFGESGKRHPSGFTFERYVEGVKAIMTAVRKAFPRSCVIQYANFMPGEWLPGSDHGYLRGVYAHADRIGVGVGSPDLLPHRKPQQNHSYALIKARASTTPAGVAVQDGNLEDRNPSTGKPVTVDELYRFGKDQLRLTYIFWGTQEPFYSNDVLPYVRRLGRSL